MARISQTEAARAFLQLHKKSPGFITPNAWDAGSAILLAEAGFPAIATTSGGIAFALGKPDYHKGDRELAVMRDQMLDRIREIVEVVNLPVNGDLEAGYGDSPDAVAKTVALAIDAGLAGGNIEDCIPGEPRLYDEGLAVARIRAARAAIDAKGGSFVLNARSDPFLVAPSEALKTAIRRGNLYREAGADCIFTPGPPDIQTVSTLVKEIKAPLNIVAGLGPISITPKAMIEAGVQRVSVGASIARAMLGFVRNTAKELALYGTIGYAKEQVHQMELNALFVKARQRG
jgi:2-methylisocitrate lyase-like PEP mutase family enzyme